MSLPAPFQDLGLDEQFQYTFAGLTGLPPSLVRPLWQPTPPDEPSIGTDWMAHGVTSQTGMFSPAQVAQGPSLITNDLGSVLQTVHEEIEVMATFYGPNSQRFAALLRDGLGINQNLEPLQSVGVFFVECGGIRTVPDLINQQWRRRTDMTLSFRRAITRQYEVVNAAVESIHLIDDTGHVNRTIPVPPSTP